MENAAKIKIALAGNPNCGKTTIFNNITGAKQHVGNYPGVTVEKKEGHRTFNGKDLLFVDLPGTYSLTARSLDEVVARNVIINEKPDIIVNVLDASNLERNLYLAAQLVELGRPMVIALNMMDIADRMGIKIDFKKLGQQLGAVVVPLVGSKNIGTKELLDAISGTQTKDLVNAKVDYGPDVEPAIANLTDAIEKMGIIKYPVRWLAVKLLENDSDAVEKVRAMEGTQSILALASTLRDSLTSKIDLDFYFAQCRYQFATDVFNKSIINVGSSDSLSDKIDSVLTHRYLGIPIFLALMWLMFVVINVGAYPQGWLDTGFSMLGDWCSDVIEDEQLRSLVVDGAIGGVGSVLSFVPLIVLLYLFISLLEDTGYMARAAFLIDRAMRALGLHGKSFIPMILGFGCNVPGIMAARTLDNEKDRLVTILACPFMSCGARLPVYTLLIAAFFGASGHGGTVLFGIYLLGIVISICVALVLRHTTFKGEQEPFVMEMPPYHIPTLKGVLMHMWERTVLYLKKAGTFILGAYVLVWFLTAYPVDVDYSQDFDAAKDQVTAEMEQKQADILQSYGLSAIEDNDALNEMYESMVAAADEAADEADENEADTGNALNPAAALSSVEDQVKDSENAEDNLFMGKYPQSFADLQEQNPAVFAQALPLFDAKADADDETSKLEDQQNVEKLEQSYAARLGHFVEPVIAPLGFDWKIGVGLIACTAAKEVMVSTLGTIYSVGGDDTHESGIVAYLRDDPDFNQAVALSLMVFVLLYMPCVAAMAVIKRETGSWKMLLASNGMCLVLSYVLAFVTYHLALMAGLGA